MMYPLKLQSIEKDIIWGGTRLSEEYGKGTRGEKIAESWVLTLREDGENRVENGILAGKTLSELGFPQPFPLLIKLIDAHDRLSVQVHPDDAYAAEVGLPAGKTEMWYIVDADEGAELVCGVLPNVSRDQLKAAAESGTLEQYLKKRPVKKGDVVFIPAGTVHAIGKGILIAEVQQNSNTTYRLYDYDRRDKDGNKRPLHLEEALRVADLSLPKDETEPKLLESGESFRRRLLCECDYFRTELLTLNASAVYSLSTDELLFVLCLDGNGTIVHNGIDYPIEKGDGYLLPADIGDCSIRTENGCELMTVRS